MRTMKQMQAAANWQNPFDKTERRASGSSPAPGSAYKLSPAQRDEVNRLIEECQHDAEAVMFRLVWQREHLLAALNDILKVANGENQVANDDTEGMEWIVNRIVAVTQNK